MPAQTVLFQDGRTPAGVTGWVDALGDPGHPATAAAGACEVGIDYARYGAARKRSLGSTPRYGWTHAVDAPVQPSGALCTRSSPKSPTVQT